MFLMKLKYITAALVACLTIANTRISVSAFAPSLTSTSSATATITNTSFNANTFHSKNSIIASHNNKPLCIQKQRRSMASIQTMSLFGLGGPEIAVIGIAILFLVGPQKLAEIARGAGEAATDFKDVPKEFQKGLEEGQNEVRAKKAKPMDAVVDSSESDSK